ncbi:hypothetical protein II810_03645 [bacterium]|nr:hypothetical protein [bacterium]
MSNSTNNPFGSATAHSTNNPFGSATAHLNKIDLSADLELIKKNRESSSMKDILNSAVGDFTERPLQIMIREIVKNFLIFTPIGWVILLYIIGRKYGWKLNITFDNLSGLFNSAIASLGIQR